MIFNVARAELVPFFPGQISASGTAGQIRPSVRVETPDLRKAIRERHADGGDPGDDSWRRTLQRRDWLTDHLASLSVPQPEIAVERRDAKRAVF